MIWNIFAAAFFGTTFIIMLLVNIIKISNGEMDMGAGHNDIDVVITAILFGAFITNILMLKHRQQKKLAETIEGLAKKLDSVQ